MRPGRRRRPADRPARQSPGRRERAGAGWIPARGAAGAAWIALVCAACGDGGPAAPSVATLEVVPGSALLVGEGDGMRFLARARDAQGTLISARADWSTGDARIATIDGDGFATAVAAGTTTVTAVAGGASAQAQLEVHVPERIASYEPGRSYLGRREYVEYIPGRLPVVLSSAHGGGLAPGEIPDRRFGTLRNDLNTLELTLEMRQALIDLTGHAPHVVLSHLQRRKLDPNREIVEAAQGNPFAELAWEEFQGWIEVARAAVAGEFGAGLYLDIHGHSHSIDRVELGYLLSADELNRPDAALNSLEVVARTSIRNLGRTWPGPFSQLLRGPESFGGLLEAEGVAVVPAPAAPGPGDAAYWIGGYNTRRHGSVEDAEVVDGIQLEHHWPGLRDSPYARRDYAEKAARVIRAYLLAHYGFMEPG